MAAHGICFDFYYRPKPSQIGQNGLAAAADARLAEVDIFTQEYNYAYMFGIWHKQNLSRSPIEVHTVKKIDETNQ